MKSSKTRIAVTLTVLLCSFPLTELVLRVVRPSYVAGEARNKTTRVLEYVLGTPIDESADGERQKRVLNPYYGFDDVSGFELIERYVSMHEHGQRDKLYTILICGGSVADMFCGNMHGGSEHLVELLESDPRLGQRSVQICRFARAAYKQPQQLQKLVYFLSRGCAPDAVVNIDGLNEVRSGRANSKYGLHPTWPAAGAWLHLTAGPTSSDEVFACYLEARATREDLLGHASWALDHGVYRSAIVGLWSQRKVTVLFERFLFLQETYVKLLARRGQQTEKDPEEDALELSVESWRESSRLMHSLCRGRGILYVHLLQPTLHDRGAKRITEEEWALGVGEAGLNPHVTEGYDLLREAGSELVSDGVPFVDASRVFAEVDQTLYRDRAHLGSAGNRILAERVAAEILARL